MSSSLAVRYLGSARRASMPYMGLMALEFLRPRSAYLLYCFKHSEFWQNKKKSDPNPAFRKPTTAREENRPI